MDISAFNQSDKITRTSASKHGDMFGMGDEMILVRLTASSIYVMNPSFGRDIGLPETDLTDLDLREFCDGWEYFNENK